MSAESPGPRVRGIFFVLAVILVLVSLLMAYKGVVGKEIQITQGPKRGPPTRVWYFEGGEAQRIGLGAAVLASAGVLMLVNGVLKGRTTWRWRTRVAVAFGLLALSTVLIMPPWPLRIPGVIPAFYGFLVPALCGVSTRSCLGVLTGVGAGVVVAFFLGQKETLNGMMPGLIAFGFLGLHLGYLIHEPFRGHFTRDVLSR